MSDLEKLLATAILVNSALFLSGCFVGGLITGNPLAWKMALLAIGFCYAGYLFQYYAAHHVTFVRLALAAVIGSILIGAAAGYALLVRG